MNYLAHLYLSSHSDDALVGGLLGDFVKGDDHHKYSKPVCEAIMIHRKIDSFTDGHDIVRRSKRRLDERFRHTRGLLVDIFYDHFLATGWSSYSSVALSDFASGAYDAIQSFEGPVPDHLERIMPYMINDDWLSSYGDLKNIERALRGLSRRMSHTNHLSEGLPELMGNYDELELDFQTFLPEVRRYVQSLTGTASQIWSESS